MKTLKAAVSNYRSHTPPANQDSSAPAINQQSANLLIINPPSSKPAKSAAERFTNPARKLASKIGRTLSPARLGGNNNNTAVTAAALSDQPPDKYADQKQTSRRTSHTTAPTITVTSSRNKPLGSLSSSQNVVKGKSVSYYPQEPTGIFNSKTKDSGAQLRSSRDSLLAGSGQANVTVRKRYTSETNKPKGGNKISLSSVFRSDAPSSKSQPPMEDVAPAHKYPDLKALSGKKDMVTMHSGPVRQLSALGTRQAPFKETSNLGSNKDIDGGRFADLERDNKVLEQRISELVHNAEGKKAEIAHLKIEINKMKEHEQLLRSDPGLATNDELELLRVENRMLKERLEQLGFLTDLTSLSDTEKEHLLKKKCSSAPPSIIGISEGCLFKAAFASDGGATTDGESDIGEASGVAPMSCPPVPEWDKQSSSSLSEMSVACLQDRIMQMEETHYSTNEELQATLQELTDLQNQISDLHVENDRLTDEKGVLLESLCSQTEKLEDCRSENANLKQLLLQQSGDGGGAGGKGNIAESEKEQKLVELLQSAQKERESLLVKQSDLGEVVHEARKERDGARRELEQTEERMRHLQAVLDSAQAERRLFEQQLAEAREQLANEQIETARVSTLLDNEQVKVAELVQTQDLRDKSELDELLDNARKEKDRVEVKAALLSNQLGQAHCEVAKLKEQIIVLQEDIMVSKNNAKTALSDLEYKLAQQNEDKERVLRESQVLQDALHEYETKCQRHLEDKRELKANVSELQKKVAELTSKLETTEADLKELNEKRDLEVQEWQQFQDDLLMTVRVANDFKTEAQQDLEKIVLENKQLKDKVKSMQADLVKLQVSKSPASTGFVSPIQSSSPASPVRVVRPGSSDSPLMTSSANTSLDGCSDLSAIIRRASPLAGINSRHSDSTRQSVKSLIESIENASKQKSLAKNSSSESINSSNCDKADMSPDKMDSSDFYIKPPLTRMMSVDSSLAARERSSSFASSIGLPLRPRNSLTDNGGSASRDSNKLPLISEKLNTSCSPRVMGDCGQDSNAPISILANKIGDQPRRQSYGDLLDKKDPLSALVKGGGSRRNALLKWCQNKMIGYKNVDITNFSSSWNDGLAFCATIHIYLPDKIPFDELDSKDKRRNFTLAFTAAESVGIPTILNINEMCSVERPDWQQVMTYVTSIYKHFET